MAHDMKACCFTGNRPHKMPLLDNENDIMNERLCEALENEICRMVLYNIGVFFTGCADGADIIAGEQVLRHKQVFPDDEVSLVCAVPFRGHERRWPEEKKKRLYHMIEQADKVIYVSEAYSKDCYQVRNEYMVDRSSVVIAVHNGAAGGGTFNTISYAKSKDREVHIIDPIHKQYTLHFPQQFETKLRVIPGEGDYQAEHDLLLLEQRKILSELLVIENNRLLNGQTTMALSNAKYLQLFCRWLEKIANLQKVRQVLRQKASLGFTKAKHLAASFAG